MATTPAPALSAEAHTILCRVVVEDLERLAQHLDGPSSGGSLYMLGDRLAAARELGVSVSRELALPEVVALTDIVQRQETIIGKALALVNAVDAANLSADEFVGVFAPLLAPLNDLADSLEDYR